MMQRKKLSLLFSLFLLFASCGGNSEEDKRIEREAKESSEDAATESLDKLNTEEEEGNKEEGKEQEEKAE